MAARLSALASATTTNTFSSEKYVKYNDPGVEPIVPNEAYPETELHEIISTSCRAISPNIVTVPAPYQLLSLPPVNIPFSNS
jgi:hypothetical protein